MTRRPTPRLIRQAAAGLCWLAIVPLAGAAETTDPLPTRTTLLILKLDAAEPVAIHTAAHAEPPGLTITFPKQRVVGSLPERSAVAKGVIRTVEARYGASGPAGTKFLDAIRIGLSAPYASRVHSEAGRIIVEIEHPAAVLGTSVEVGLKGGTVIEGAGSQDISQRFRAMQDALARVTPTPWSMQFGIPEPEPAPQPHAAAAFPSAALAAAPAAAVRPASAPSAARRAAGWGLGWLGLMALAALAGLRFRGAFGSWRQAQFRAAPEPGRRPSGVQLLDELVWKAFERQGYQPILETEFPQPLAGPLRLLMKDGAKTALCFIGNGPFFEKQTVEQFLRAMRTLRAAQGFLVASGSFTVPAQRVAAEHHITLIGREELVGLLSAGAGLEHLARQLTQQQTRIEEAQETLRQYTGELDVLRRQRNEASWYLGEERANTAQLEAKIAELTQQLRHHESELQQREQEIAGWRRQWEENEWYLGEARARARYLESQLGASQDAAAAEGGTEPQALQEERAQRAALEAKRAQLQQQVDALSAREQQLQGMLRSLGQKLTILQSFGERRRLPRGRIAEARVELRDGEAEALFAGCPLDLGPSGFGLETNRLVPEYRSYRVQLSIPGGKRIEANARLLWQRVEENGQRVRSGYRILRMPAAVRERITELITSS